MKPKEQKSFMFNKESLLIHTAELVDLQTNSETANPSSFLVLKTKNLLVCKETAQHSEKCY